MGEHQFDRAAETVGSSIHLEHVNLRIADQLLATRFYVSGLGLTRDPYLMTGTDNMWVNVGRSQFHLPTGAAQILRGITGIVVPDRAALLDRLTRTRKDLGGTAFDFREGNDCVEAVCPWGNRICCHAPDAERFGPMVLGIPYVELAVPPGSSAGIARFYRDIVGLPAEALDVGAPAARVAIGSRQQLLFRETDTPVPPYDGHHIQIYVTDFGGLYRRLAALDLISEENGRHQYRFTTIIDPVTRASLYALEHEIRSLTHPLYGRPLVNRNPGQSNMRYQPGHDALSWAMGGER